MPELVVCQQGRRIFRVPLETASLSIGRSLANDLILEGSLVSRRHATVVKTDQGFALRDESKMGTQINGERLQGDALLKDQDQIMVGDWVLHYSVASPLLEQEEQQKQTQLTQLRAAGRDLTAVLELSQETFRVCRPLLLIDDAKTGKRHVHLKKTRVVVGSSPECDVVLNDEFVSKQHALFQLSDKGFLVTDLDSRNGTFIHGAKIQECYLKSDEVIELGRSKILVSFAKESESKLVPFKGENFCGIVGCSAGMKMLFSQIRLVADTGMTVLIQGETGTGKEMVAQALHELSSRRSKPFVAVNCGAIAENLIESELFGHEKGAFTGALERRVGFFEQAHTGTLFLDEVGELPLHLQAKILRVLEYQVVRRVGGQQETKVDVRLLAATHRDLPQMVTQGSFREDLFYRLHVLPLLIPPLRERPEDIRYLSAYFVKKFGGDQRELDEGALSKLCAHRWPGNVRELKNTLLRALTFHHQKRLTADDIDFVQFPDRSLSEDRRDPLSPHALDDLERERMVKALQEAHGDKNKAAAILNMGRSTLFRKIKQWGIKI